MPSVLLCRRLAPAPPTRQVSVPGVQDDRGASRTEDKEVAPRQEQEHKNGPGYVQDKEQEHKQEHGLFQQEQEQKLEQDCLSLHLEDEEHTYVFEKEHQHSYSDLKKLQLKQVINRVVRVPEKGHKPEPEQEHNHEQEQELEQKQDQRLLYGNRKEPSMTWKDFEMQAVETPEYISEKELRDGDNRISDENLTSSRQKLKIENHLTVSAFEDGALAEETVCEDVSAQTKGSTEDCSVKYAARKKSNLSGTNDGKREQDVEEEAQEQEQERNKSGMGMKNRKKELIKCWLEEDSKLKALKNSEKTLESCNFKPKWEDVAVTSNHNQRCNKSNEYRRKDLSQTVCHFAKSSLFEHRFPPSLNSYERGLVHREAQKWGLDHQSYGQGAARFLVLTKPRHPSVGKGAVRAGLSYPTLPPRLLSCPAPPPTRLPPYSTPPPRLLSFPTPPAVPVAHPLHPTLTPLSKLLQSTLQSVEEVEEAPLAPSLPTLRQQLLCDLFQPSAEVEKTPPSPALPPLSQQLVSAVHTRTRTSMVQQEVEKEAAAISPLPDLSRQSAQSLHRPPRPMSALAAATPATSTICVVSQGQGYTVATCPLEIEKLRRQFEERALLVPEVEDERLPGENGVSDLKEKIKELEGSLALADVKDTSVAKPGKTKTVVDQESPGGKHQGLLPHPTTGLYTLAFNDTNRMR